MTFNGILQLLLYMVVLLALARPLGRYMARVYEGQPTGLNRIFGPLERLIYWLCGVRTNRPEAEMDWKTYAFAMLLFNLCGSDSSKLASAFRVVLRCKGFGF